MSERTFSIRAVFAVVYTASISSVYFALGVVAHRANGLTPVVFLAGGIFFSLSAMVYAEGASMRAERGGSAAFARHAFNELVSFVAGWSIVLDYTILLAVAAVSVPAYLSAFGPPIGRGALEVAVAIAVIAFVAVDNLTGVNIRRLRRRIIVTGIDLAVQAAVIGFGLALALHPERLTDAIHLGTAPTASDLAFAFPIAVIAFTGIEAAASLAGEVTIAGPGVKRLVLPGAAVIVLIYVGISFVSISALPVHHGVSELGQRHIRAPLLGVVESLRPVWISDVLKYIVAVSGAVGLTAAAGSAMLGVSRVGYALATNRQIPSRVGRLSGRWGTPYVVIGAASLAAVALAIPRDLDLLVGIYAFGALTAFLIAHLSVIALRYRDPEHHRGYEVPLSIRFRGGSLPLPAVFGAILAGVGLAAVVIFHTGARWVGLGWLLSGLTLYVVYRTTQGKPLLKRVTIPERALRQEAPDSEFGSILVPIFGTALDDDIVQTAGRLAGETHDDVDEEGAVIEAIWVFEMPLSLPLDAPLPDAQVQRARDALKRAKAVGEEYEGVEVATAMVRARRAGQAIVNEAKRRGVEAIVLGAEEPSRVRGGGLLGGSSPLDNYVGEITKYVIGKAPCRVILTAPPADWQARFAREHADLAPAPATEVETPATAGGEDDGRPADAATAERTSAVAESRPGPGTGS